MSQFVNNQLDVGAVLKSEFDLNLRPKDVFSCKNPHHRDSSASCVYYGPQLGTFCWGCNKAYFGLDFIMFARDITYYEALKVAETEYEVELPTKDDEVKQVNKSDKLKYEKLIGISIKNKKALHNLCVALNAIAEEDDSSYNKYCEMKGLKND